MNKFYQNKVVWITGASSGIGEALVQELAQTGAKIVLSARRKEELERVAKENKLTSDNSLILPLDLENYKDFDKDVKQVIQKFGTIDVLIGNGGISQRSLAHETGMVIYESLMKVNYFGNIALTLAVLPWMREKKTGWISTISSVAGKFGVPLRTGYSATKSALTGFYEALRAENRNENIKVTLIYPGFIRTQISKNALTKENKKQGVTDEAIEKGLDPNLCAREILEGIASEKLEVVIAGLKEKLGIFLHKHFPKLFAGFIAKTKVT